MKNNEKNKEENDNLLNQSIETAEVYEQMDRADGTLLKYNRMVVVYTLTERFVVFHYYYN